MKVFLFLLTMLYSVTLFADNIKRPNSYNLVRGVEAVQNNNIEEALKYLNMEISEHPDDGYAYFWIAYINNVTEDFGEALTAINVAIKKIPSKDKLYKSLSYSTRAKVYLNLEDTMQALRDYTTAIEATPEGDELYNCRAQLYFELGKYELADKDYRKIISLKEGDVVGYMGLGRDAYAQEKYEDAIRQFDYVVKLVPSYSPGYAFRGYNYISLKKYSEALDDIITALSIDNDENAFNGLQLLVDSATDITIAKLKIQKLKNPNEISWMYYLGVAYQRIEKYHDAITEYKGYLSKEQSDVVASNISDCYSKLGQYEMALDFCNQAIALDTTETQYLVDKVLLEEYVGLYNQAIMDMTEILKQNPDFATGYYERGWLRDMTKDYTGAIEDYTMAIMLDPADPASYMRRGVMYIMNRDEDKARADFLEVVRLDSVPEDAVCAHFAYFYLGEREKAIEVMNAVLKTEDKGNQYDAACLYSLMGEKQTALSHLRKALEMGYCNFAHMEVDCDLDNIRNIEEYKSLIEEYKRKLNVEKEPLSSDTSVYKEKIEEIPFTKDGEMCKVKCFINKLPLVFIFDTGATDVSVSSVEATFMVKNDYLCSKDIFGTQRYLNANGEVSEGMVINLREVKIGNLQLNNVKASVVKNQSAPLLLGQSVLSRLGKIEIDNNRKVLRVTYKEKIKLN